MLSSIQLKNHPFVTSSNDIAEICKPLEKIGIDNFIYVRHYNDNKYSFLSNTARWNAHFLENFYKLRYKETYLFQECVQQDMLLSTHTYPNNLAFTEANQIMGLQHGFVISRQNLHFKEVIYFASKDSEPSIFNCYLYKRDLIHQFLDYFKERAHAIIQQSEKLRLDTPQAYLDYKLAMLNSSQLSSAKEQEFLKEISYKRNDHKLTARETECFYWLVQGKSADEIGIIIGISGRTVEKYIENMKIKFNCAKITQLIYKLAHAVRFNSF